MRRATAAGLGALLSAGLLAAAGGAARAHGGGLDDLGCHHVSETGAYHCHRGPLDGRSFESEAAARRALGRAGGTGAGAPAYDRELYGGWRDRDGDCQDTRTEVLIAEADGWIRLTDGGCEVRRGRWVGPYTGEVINDPSELHVDHRVPLKEAHRSGARRWPARKRRRYATDLRHDATLAAVDAEANMAKGADGPADWLPPERRCRYVRRWLKVKRAWGLRLDPRERAAIRQVRRRC